MRTVAMSGALVMLAGAMAGAAGGGAGAAGEGPRPGAGAWTQFRGDAALTGRSTAKGRIRTPSVLWKRFIGARETLVRVRLNGGDAGTARLPEQDLHADRAGAVPVDWGLGGLLYDLD